MLIYEKTNGVWRYRLSTHRDYAYADVVKTQILDQLHHNHQVEQIGADILQQEHLVIEAPFPQAHYGFVIVCVSRVDNKHLTFTPCPPESEEYRVMDKFIQLIQNSEYAEYILAKNTIGSAFAQAIALNSGCFESRNILPEPIEAGSDDDLFINSVIDDIEHTVIGNLYSLIRDLPVLSGGGQKIPANIFFSIKYYGNKETLNRSAWNPDDGCDKYEYPYSHRMLLSAVQKKDILATFNKYCRTIKDKKRNVNDGTFEYIRNDGSIESNEDYMDKNLADWFWSIISKESRKKADNRDFSELLNPITAPFGKPTRGLADPGLTSGYVHIRPIKFINGIETRVSQEELRKGDISIENRRLAVMHYLYASASPNSTNNTLGIIVVPLQVWWRTYLSMNFTTILKQQGRNIERSIATLTRHHHYSNVVSRVADKARHLTRESYLKHVGDIFYSSFECLERRYVDDFISNANKKYRLLGRAIPYPFVNLDKKPISTRLHGKVEIPGLTPIYFSISKNTTFHQYAPDHGAQRNKPPTDDSWEAFTEERELSLSIATLVQNELNDAAYRIVDDTLKRGRTHA